MRFPVFFPKIFKTKSGILEIDQEMFHAAEEKTMNARGPIVTVQVHGTYSRPVSAERKWERKSTKFTRMKYPTNLFIHFLFYFSVKSTIGMHNVQQLNF